MNARTLAERKREEEKQKRLDKIYRERSERAAKQMEGESPPTPPSQAVLPGLRPARPSSCHMSAPGQGEDRQANKLGRDLHVGAWGRRLATDPALPQDALTLGLGGAPAGRPHLSLAPWWSCWGQPLPLRLLRPGSGR